jgi:hypothetical protein
MPCLNLTPTDKHADPSHNLNAELQAFLEAFSMLELGSIPKELLSKIA